MQSKHPTRALIIAATAAIWIAGTALHRWVAPLTEFAPGIDLIYPPAGMRTLLLIVGGVWAAIGLTVANFVLIPDDIGLQTLASRVLFSAYAGVAPYVAMIGSFSVLGLSPSLKDLSPRHLPILCFGIAVGSSVLHVAAFCLIGSVPWSSFIAATAAMALGDFTGCLIVILIALSVIKAFKRTMAS